MGTIPFEPPVTASSAVDPEHGERLAAFCQALGAIASGFVADPGILAAGVESLHSVAVAARAGGGLPGSAWTATLTPLPQVGRSLLSVAGPGHELHLQLDSADSPFVASWQGQDTALTFAVEAGVFRALAPVEMAIPIGAGGGWTAAPQFLPQDEGESGPGSGLAAGALFGVGGMAAALAAVLARRAARPQPPPQMPGASPTQPWAVPGTQPASIGPGSPPGQPATLTAAQPALIGPGRTPAPAGQAPDGSLAQPGAVPSAQPAPVNPGRAPARARQIWDASQAHPPAVPGAQPASVDPGRAPAPTRQAPGGSPAQPAAVPAAQAGAAERRCTTCGMALRAGARFCGTCGVPAGS